MAELKGSLGSLGLPAIVQLIGELHHSGNLELSRGASRGVLGFDDGRLVAASYNDELRGLSALTACTRELVDGEFVFVEGTPVGERTLDLGGSELQRLFGRIIAGEDVSDSPEAVPAHAAGANTAEACPLLGFVDDATRHYARPTALHRCYASGAAGLVSAHEQRDLCLSGRHTSCPRFRNAGTPTVAGSPSVAAPVALVAASPSRPAAASRERPAGIAARLDTPSQTHLANGSLHAADALPVDLQADPPAAVHAPSSGEDRFAFKSRRGLLLLALGSLALLVAALLVARGLLPGASEPMTPPLAAPSSSAAPTSPPRPTGAAGVVAQPKTVPSPVAPTGGVIVRSAPTALPAQAPAVVPATVPALVPQSAAAAAPAAQAAVPTTVPTVAVAGVAVGAPAPEPGQSLVDVRFASGPKPGWLENPPYALWSDGAYRLKALQPTRFVVIGAPVQASLSDVVVSATMRKTGGPPGGGYGLIVRNQTPVGLDGVNQSAMAYVMEAGDRGEFGVWRRDGDHWIDLVPWTRSDSVRPGGSPNDLEVRAVGDQLTFSVNGAELASIQDATFSSGGVGLFVGGDYNEVAVDRFVATVPD